jgi:HAD superfamily hydrolase (TIGR01509 family)
MRGKAYIFDLDGTLVDTEILWVEAIGTFLRDHGVDVSDEWVVGVVFGKAWRDVYATICREVPQVAHMPLAEMQDAIDPYFYRLRDRSDVRIPGSVELLKRLAAETPVCIVSGSPRRDLEHAVEQLGIRDLLAFSLASEDYARGKPDPSCYLLAAEKFGVPPPDCVAFEDSAAGLRAAKTAGMRCVVLRRDNAPPQDLSEADLILSDLADFVEK